MKCDACEMRYTCGNTPGLVNGGCAITPAQVVSRPRRYGKATEYKRWCEGHNAALDLAIQMARERGIRAATEDMRLMFLALAADLRAKKLPAPEGE